MITDFHAKLFANELLRRCPADSVERITATLMGSQVDLNPHQVDAALFAFRSPLSKGAILADEVGLGKTVEAGIVLSQKWAERKRKILIVLPSSLRKQWYQELQEKFYLPSEILEAKSFNKAVKEGRRNPFESAAIAICSYHFARNKADYIRKINWDLVVIDEAHRLRNVYKSGNRIARQLREALAHAPKILLTATPLQNSLLELYGLASFIDEHAFGDLRSFRSQFARITSDETFDDLKRRLQPICKRTLRRQVLEYIRYTARCAHTQEFTPSEEEETLYELVSDYLQTPNLQALPNSQRTLITLILRKLLASSTFAIAGALESLANKLERSLAEDNTLHNQDEGIADIADDFERFDELLDEAEDGSEVEEGLSVLQREAIRSEMMELRHFVDLAMDITENAKGQSLLQALEVGFRMTTELGGAEKAIIFTESRRTQNYLIDLLSRYGYGDDLVLFNGSNSDEQSRAIYAEWKARYAGTDQLTGSRSADTRAALVGYFRDRAKIMIATEAAAEGINLQFCSLVVNYDLPWNPQRIEQRIGRCHRYGQKHDVVVVNFLNRNNAADQRVFELLSEKFRLFDGVFGASDEVLGSIESGVDFEKRITEIYQTCRTSEEIQASFDSLQAELSVEIDENMRATRRKLLENFDVEVAEKLNVYQVETNRALSRYEALLWGVTQHELGDRATFDEPAMTFELARSPEATVSTGRYTLNRQDASGHHYHLQHPLAQRVLTEAKGRALSPAGLVFDYGAYGGNMAAIAPLIGRGGLLMAQRLTVQGLEAEDAIVLVAMTENGERLTAEQANGLFKLPATVERLAEAVLPTEPLTACYGDEKERILGTVSARNAQFFEEEIEKLDRWADDRRQSLKGQLKDYDDQIGSLKQQAREARNLPEKLGLQKQVSALNKKRDEAWREYDRGALDVERQKDDLIESVAVRLQQSVEEETLFVVRWRLVA